MVVALIALVVAIVVVLSNKSANKESAAKLEGLDSVLTTPSSLNPVGSNVPLADSHSSFILTVNTDSSETILNGPVTVSFNQGGWKSTLSFRNVLGVSEEAGGPYDELSIVIKTGKVIYLKINDMKVYRVRVKEETRGNVTLVFERL
jgi:hypothetical protein